MKKLCFPLIILLCACFPSASGAQNKPLSEADLAREYAKCAAYNIIVSACQKDDPLRPGVADIHLGWSKIFYTTCSSLSDEHFALRRIKRAQKLMKDEMRDCSRIPVLMDKYHCRCKALGESIN